MSESNQILLIYILVIAIIIYYLMGFIGPSKEEIKEHEKAVQREKERQLRKVQSDEVAKAQREKEEYLARCKTEDVCPSCHGSGIIIYCSHCYSTKMGTYEGGDSDYMWCENCGKKSSYLDENFADCPDCTGTGKYMG